MIGLGNLSGNKWWQEYLHTVNLCVGPIQLCLDSIQLPEERLGTLLLHPVPSQMLE